MRKAAVPALILFPLAWGASAAPMPARTQSAEQALSNYRKVFTSTKELDCPRGGSTDEIVVCGHRESETQSARLPLPVEPEPGARRGLIAGEPPSAMAAMKADQCISRCPGNVSINLLAIPGLIGKVVERVKDE